MKMIVLRGPIPTNCFILIDDNKENCYIIDPGYKSEKLFNYVTNNNLTVLGILLTHAHYDHIGYVDIIPEVPIYLHQEDLMMFYNDFYNGLAYRFTNHSIEDRQLNLAKLNIKTFNNLELKLGSKLIKSVHTPGHTPGSVCYEYDNKLFTGDLLFKENVGPFDIPLSDQRVLSKTVINFIESYKVDKKIYPSHGRYTTVFEQRKNPFYLKWKDNEMVRISGVAKEDEYLYYKAIDYIKEGNLEDALKLYNELFIINPHSDVVIMHITMLKDLLKYKKQSA